MFLGQKEAKRDEITMFKSLGKSSMWVWHNCYNRYISKCDLVHYRYYCVYYND